MNLNFENKIFKIQSSPAVRNSRNSIFEIVVLVAAAVLLYWFVVLPKAAVLADKQSQLEKVKVSTALLQANIASLKKLSQELSSHTSDVAHLDQALPLNEIEVRTEVLMQKLVESSGVVISSLVINASGSAVVSGNQALLMNPYGPKRTLGSVPINMSVSGSLTQLLDLLNKLENYGRIMEINSMDISTAENGTLNLSLTLETYYYSAP